MIDWKKKLTSRKFWMAIAGFVSMLIVFFGGSDELAAQITSLILAGATVIAYVIAEGLVDANATGIEDGILYEDYFDVPVDANEPGDVPDAGGGLNE